jgi:transcriptional regulator with XRE-family HTH domain
MSVMAKPKRISDPGKPTRAQWSVKLKDLRTKRGLSQHQAADLAGLPVRTWISWENRQHVPSKFVRQSLAKIFPELA